MAKRTLTKQELNELDVFAAGMTGSILGMLEHDNLVTLKQLCEAKTYEEGYSILEGGYKKATGKVKKELDNIWPYMGKDENVVVAILTASKKFCAEDWSNYYLDIITL